MLNLDFLNEMTLPQVWQRGEDLCSEGAVHLLTKQENEWSADVLGSRWYHVSINVENGSVASWNCNCPYDHGAVCKHVVALALAAEAIGDVEVIEEAINILDLNSRDRFSDLKQLKELLDTYKRRPAMMEELSKF